MPRAWVHENREGRVKPLRWALRRQASSKSQNAAGTPGAGQNGALGMAAASEKVRESAEVIAKINQLCLDQGGPQEH